ncbi:MAG: trypsin-like peptidase domain-containing protein [Candidatus Brocadiia bacterium]
MSLVRGIILGLLLAGLVFGIWFEAIKPAGAGAPEKKVAVPSVPLPDSGTLTPKSFVTVGRAVSPATVILFCIVKRDGKTGQSTGTGFIVDKKKGYVLTNEHVVAEAESITVVLQDERELEAKVVGVDPRPSDVAVVQITNPPPDLSQAVLGDSNKVEVGEFVVAIGNPLNVGYSLTMGVVSALREMEKDEDPIMELESHIQTDVAINQGNSGGPLINLRGEVVGINSSIVSRTGGNWQGIGNSIPINRAKAIMELLIRDGQVRRPYLGAVTAEINERLAKAYNHDNRDKFMQELKIQKPNGAFIRGVEPDSPAAEAGLREGDIIVEIGKFKIESPKMMLRALGKVKDRPDNVEVKIIREGQEQSVAVNIKVR